MPNKKIGYDETNPVAQYVKVMLQYNIEEAIKMGYRRFIAGGALGVDTWAGEIVAELKDIYLREQNILLTLDLFAPFEGQEGNWPLESQIRYFNLMAKCDTVRYICEAGYAGWKMIVRDKAMVDEADLVIAVWNGDLGKSGTGHTVSYAQKVGKPILIIDPREAMQ